MHAKEIYELVIALGGTSFLGVVAVGVYLYLEADERHLFDSLKPSNRPPAETPAPPARAPSAVVEPKPAPVAKQKAMADPPARPPVFAFPVSEDQIRRKAREAVAGSPERLRRLEALFAERDAVIRSGGTPPSTTAQDLLRNL